MKSNENLYTNEEILKELNDTNLGDFKLGDKSINEFFSNIPKLNQVLYSSSKIVLDFNVLESNSLSCENLFLEYDKNENLLSSGELNKINEKENKVKKTPTESSYSLGIDFNKEEIKIKNEKEENKKKEKKNESESERESENENRNSLVEDKEFSKDGENNKEENENKNENKIENESKHKLDPIFDILEDKENLNEKNNNKININEEEKIKKLKQEKNQQKLKEDHCPIDVIESLENYTGIKQDEKIDLFPLNSFKLKDDLNINFLEKNDIQVPNNEKITCINFDTKNNIYLGTKNGKIIKIDQNKKIETIEDYESLDQSEDTNYGFISSDPITCLDICDNYILTGHEKGNIFIWFNNRIIKKAEKVHKSGILYVKFLTIKNGNKVKFLSSDSEGQLYFNKLNIRNENKIEKMIQKKKNNSKANILNDALFPVYKLLLFSPTNKSISASWKIDDVILICVTKSYVVMYLLFETFKKINFKEIYKIDKIENLNSDYIFDASFGNGNPPINDKNKTNSKTSISDSFSICEGVDNSMLAISYGPIMLLYKLKINKKGHLNIEPIGHFINDKPILRIEFLGNSFLSLFINNKKIKLINTFDFIAGPYDYKNLVTKKKSLINYEQMDLSKEKIQNNSITDFEGKEVYLYTNTIRSNNNGSIYLLTDNKLILCKLSLWEESLDIKSLNKQYEKILWFCMTVLNKKRNIFNNKLTFDDNNKLKNIILMRLFGEIVIPDLQKGKEESLRMIFEFFIETNFFDFLPIFNQLSEGKGVDNYVYKNFTRYLINGDLKESFIESIFINKYIDYYINQNKKLLLNKVLLNLNIKTLIQNDIVNRLKVHNLINPYIYATINNGDNYFLALNQLSELFNFEISIKKQHQFILENLKTEKEREDYKQQIETKIDNNYINLIITGDKEYLDENTLDCHEYFGHKLMWYCDKCLSGKKYPNNSIISENIYINITNKILMFLMDKENMKNLMEFDSYTYMKLITKFFTEKKLSKLIKLSKGNYLKEISCESKNQINDITKEKKADFLSGEYIYNSIKNFIERATCDTFYMKYDFCEMTTIICNICNFIIDEKIIKNILKFYLDYNFKNWDIVDIFNCHKKPKINEEINIFVKKIGNYMINLLNYLRNKDYLNDEYVNQLLSTKKIEVFKDVHFYLLEFDKQYEKCLKMKIDNYYKNIEINGEEEIKILFGWIENTIENTFRIDYINKNIMGLKEKKGTELQEYNKSFKSYLLKNLKILCDISMEELSVIIDNWFDDQKEEVIMNLGGGNSNRLQLKYIQHFFEIHKHDVEENIEGYIKFLELWLDLLSKKNDSEGIEKLLHEYKILCNNKTLNILLKRKVYECCIYIYQIMGDPEKGIELSIKIVENSYNNLMQILTKPHYNPLLIDIELEKMDKYYLKGLEVCQSISDEKKKENYHINENWLTLLNKACFYRKEFKPKYEQNTNNIKTKDYKKIDQKFKDCIQLILDKMGDYITLPLLVGIVADNCRGARLVEFYSILDKVFFSFRRSEDILKCAKESVLNYIIIELNNLEKINTTGMCLPPFELIRNELCNYDLCIIFNNYKGKFKIFKCGHKYHEECCASENQTDVCYICRKEEINQANNIIGKDFMEANVINQNQDENHINNLKKNEKKLLNALKRSRLAGLKKLRNKKREANNMLCYIGCTTRINIENY